mmetsp:Transcript_75249/g.156750  ORF Transcript_75249/g.156750 Transcript_75249/m.156750 type:complete len:236 (-) Transcript_75249:947-1654(-)
MVWVFSLFSSLRNSEASMSAFFKSAISLLKTATSCWRAALAASLVEISPSRVSISPCEASLEVMALDISSSQNIFAVFSSAAWASRRLTRSLMSSRTLTKWSSESDTLREAAERRGDLSSFAAVANFAAIFEATSWMDEEARCEERLSCRKDCPTFVGVPAGSSTYTQWPLRATLPAFFCKSTNLLLACQFGATPSFNAVMASSSARNSSARVCERWSHRLAFVWQSSVKTFRNS